MSYCNNLAFFFLQEMSADILDHGADLRYLSFAVQKYMEEAKVTNF